MTLLGQTLSVPLGGPSGVGFRIAQWDDVVRAENDPGMWRVHTREYIYGFTIANERTLLRFDWHPESLAEGRVLYPHLHLSYHTDPVNLSKAHVPAGRVSRESLVRFAIRDLQVPPQHPNWEPILAESERAFAAARPW